MASSIPGWQQQILQQMEAAGQLSGVPWIVLAAICQAESSGEGGSINSEGYGGFFGLGAGHNYPTGTSTTAMLEDTSPGGFTAQAQIAAGEFAALLGRTGGNIYQAEADYQGGGTEGTNVFAEVGVPTTANGAAPAGSPNYTANSATTPTGGTAPGTAPAIQNVDASGQPIPAPPGLNDIPALIQYIKQYFGADAWLLNVSPQVAQIIEDAVAQGRGNDTAYIQTLIEGTNWFQSTSKAVQQFEQSQAANPADYNFNVPGSLAAQTLQNVMAAAATQGVSIDQTVAQTLAMNYLQYGWDSQQLNAAIGDAVYLTPTTTGQGYVTNAGGIIQQLQAQAGQYLMNPNDPTLQSWAENIAAGTQTIQQFDAYLKQNASLKWTGMAPQIAQGYTPEQITNSLRTQAAQIMEVDPSQVDFVNNPMYSTILDYAPPGAVNGQHRLMTQNEEAIWLKSQPAWSDTTQARQQVGTLADTIVNAFGKGGSSS